METVALVTVGIIILNLIVSYMGFTDPRFSDTYSFRVDRILVHREYWRLVTSGFLHVSWPHLLFNMFSLYIFSGGLEGVIGAPGFITIYLVSLICGDLFALFIHRNHPDYSSVGASGAVCGIIFASIALFPGMHVGFFFLPISIPAWLYGLLYIAYSIYGIRSKKDNVGHEAHLGGALAGMIAALAMQPSVLRYNLVPVLVVALPAILFIYLCITRPDFLLVNNYFSKRQHYLTIDHKYNAAQADREREVDRILEKIHRRGMGSLTRKEKETLGKSRE